MQMEAGQNEPSCRTPYCCGEMPSALVAPVGRSTVEVHHERGEERRHRVDEPHQLGRGRGKSQLDQRRLEEVETVAADDLREVHDAEKQDTRIGESLSERHLVLGLSRLTLGSEAGLEPRQLFWFEPF